MAESAAFTCRVSSSTTSNPACTRPACSHCESSLGLVPSERSSGTRRRQVGIAKSGNGHARTMLIEADW
ncbi:transposase (plasmid) [Microvirga sp. VF16]|nr:transposase [Microvirga sp. VF16]